MPTANHFRLTRLIPLLAMLPALGTAVEFMPTLDPAWLNGPSTDTGQSSANMYRYHTFRVDAGGGIVPWHSSNLGQSYHDALMRTWGWFSRMPVEPDPNARGAKFHMCHQVFKHQGGASYDGRGIGGDQVSMFLSSLDLLYNYTGDPAMLAEARYQAGFYLANSLSAPGCQWPHLPFPYNWRPKGGRQTSVYNGDMVVGVGFTQPDKAGSFAWELIKLYQKTGEVAYRDAAVRIAATLASKVIPGDLTHSPWPFKVNVDDSTIPTIPKPPHEPLSYTTNYTGTLELFHRLNALGLGDAAANTRVINLVTAWLRTIAAPNNKWGPFFEDVQGWSDTQTNATSYAMYLLLHPETDPGWRQTVPGIFTWAHTRLNNDDYLPYQVQVVREQTSYPIEGQSHSARQAATEILHWNRTGDASRLRNAIRMLSWATYTIERNGSNRYPKDDVWFTDGYADYWRHYLRAMAAAPQLAPDDANHLLSSSSIITGITYEQDAITYGTFDAAAIDVLRLTAKPARVTVDGQALAEVGDAGQSGWMWQSLAIGGILRVSHPGKAIVITTGQAPGVLRVAEVFPIVVEGASGATTLTVTVSRSGGSHGSVSIPWSTVDGTATASDGDFRATKACSPGPPGRPPPRPSRSTSWATPAPNPTRSSACSWAHPLAGRS